MLGIESARWPDGPSPSGAAQGFGLIPVDRVGEAAGVVNEVESSEKIGENGDEGTFSIDMTCGEMTFGHTQTSRQDLEPNVSTHLALYRRSALPFLRSRSRVLVCRSALGKGPATAMNRPNHVQPCACRAPPRHMRQCNEGHIETNKHENVKPGWHVAQKIKRHRNKQTFRKKPKKATCVQLSIGSLNRWYDSLCFSHFAAPFTVFRAQTSMTSKKEKLTKTQMVINCELEKKREREIGNL